MPIEGRTLEEAAAEFREHLNRVFARTATRSRLVLVAGPPPVRRVQLAFRQAGRVIEAPLRTQFGRASLYVGQTCESTCASSGQQELRTVSYRYTLRLDGQEEAIFRWEYAKAHSDEKKYCRHHLQGEVPLRIGRHESSLNDLHVPTGFVTIEEILRFCIVDLGVAPLSPEWDDLLVESYERFKTKFAPRG